MSFKTNQIKETVKALIDINNATIEKAHHQAVSFLVEQNNAYRTVLNIIELVTKKESEYMNEQAFFEIIAYANESTKINKDMIKYADAKLRGEI